MTANITMRARVLALAGLLAVVLLGGGTFMMSRSGGAEPAPDVTSPQPVSRPADASSAPDTATTPQPTSTTGTKKPAAAPQAKAQAKAQAKPLDTKGLPAPVARALQVHDVVVVALVSPKASVDAMAADEARAGAARAGAGFVRIAVADRQDLKRLTAELRVRHTPSVLVFTRPDRLFVHVKGFADRDTVAQAAANAS